MFQVMYSVEVSDIIHIIILMMHSSAKDRTKLFEDMSFFMSNKNIKLRILTGSVYGFGISGGHQRTQNLQAI